MSQTAFSRHFDCELDVKQLLKRRGVSRALEDEIIDLSADERAWMRADLRCPSCGCAGASIVLSDVARSARRSTRQAHFRFLSASGGTAHTLGCDFFPLNDEVGLSSGAAVDFTANDRDTRVIRELVCKAIATGVLSKGDIYNMRGWFLSQRDANSFEVRGTPAMADWVFGLLRIPYEPFPFAPLHVDLPGFRVGSAVQRHLKFLYGKLPGEVPRVAVGASVRDRAKRLIVTHAGGRLIAMEHLRSKLEATVSLARLMLDYGALKLSIRQIHYMGMNAPPALLAFSATLLFVSSWDSHAALARFGEIIAAPAPSDDTAGNVIGLNPFHDYAALEMTRYISALPETGTYDLQAETASLTAMVERALAERGRTIA